MVDTQFVPSLPWYRSLSGPQWKTLAAANLSWTLDSFEFYALFVTVGFALHQLVSPAQYASTQHETIIQTAIDRESGSLSISALSQGALVFRSESWQAPDRSHQPEGA